MKTTVVSCYRARGETGTVRSGKHKERERFAVSLPASLAGVAFGLAGGA